MLETDDDLWGEVAKYKTRKGFPNNNIAVNDLIKKGLLSDNNGDQKNG